VHSPTVVAVEDDVGELVGVGLGSESFEGTVVARHQDPPRRLALVAVLAHEHRGRVDEPQPDHRTLGSRPLRGIFEHESTGLRQVEEEATGVAELEHEVLGATANPLHRVTHERLGWGYHRLQCGEAERLDRFEHRAGEHRVEALGQSLHLREFGHRDTNSYRDRRSRRVVRCR